MKFVNLKINFFPRLGVFPELNIKFEEDDGSIFVIKSNFYLDFDIEKHYAKSIDNNPMTIMVYKDKVTGKRRSVKSMNYENLELLRNELNKYTKQDLEKILINSINKDLKKT